jgi:hypothetical protein
MAEKNYLSETHPAPDEVYALAVQPGTSIPYILEVTRPNIFLFYALTKLGYGCFFKTSDSLVGLF